MQTKNEREIAMSDKKFADFQLQPYLLTAIQKINFSSTDTGPTTSNTSDYGGKKCCGTIRDR